MNFAVIGTNFISDRFADAVSLAHRDGYDVKIGAVYSRKLDTGKSYAERHGIEKVYTDYDNMLLDDMIDAVYVASPTMLHCEHSVKAMQSGHDVLCEKMMAHSLEAFYDMRNTAHKTGRVLIEAMRPDFDPALEVIRSAIPSLGKIRRASFEYCQYSSRYDKFLSGELTNAFNPKMYNSALADIGIYPLHLCVSLFGEPKDLVARSLFLSNGFEGEGSILMNYSDMLATVTYSKISESVNPSVIEGELGSLTLDKINAPQKIILHERGHAPVALPYTPPINNMKEEVIAFMNIVREKNAEQYLSLTEKVQKCVDKAYRSSGVTFS